MKYSAGLTASPQLNWPTIDALVFERDAQDLTLIEIAENLHRKELSLQDKARLQTKWLRKNLKKAHAPPTKTTAPPPSQDKTC
jgi:hypothetical protein